MGASFGGYSVYWLAGNHDKRFKAFIAHDGIYNTQQQYVETEELWFPNWDMGSAPWKRAADGQVQKVFATSPHLFVDRWDTPILCIHGQRDFRIERVLGQGSFGITYVANVRLKGRLGAIESTAMVAIKEFFLRDVSSRNGLRVFSVSDSTLCSDYRRDFLREAQNLSRLDNDHICRIAFSAPVF